MASGPVLKARHSAQFRYASHLLTHVWGRTGRCERARKNTNVLLLPIGNALASTFDHHVATVRFRLLQKTFLSIYFIIVYR